MKYFKDIIRKFRGKLVYEIYTRTKEHPKEFLCYREYLDGRKKCRNMYCNMYGGYQAYGTPDKMDTCTLKNTPQCAGQHASVASIKAILEDHPNFIYTFKKFQHLYLHEVFPALKMWLEHPEMEILLNMNFDRIAMNKKFYKMKKENQKAAIRYFIDTMPKNTPRSNFPLLYITEAMKLHISISEYIQYYRYRAKNITYEEYKNLKGKGISMYDFSQFKHKLERHFPERLKDTYWTKFKDVKDFHAKERKVNNQIRAIEELKAEKDRKAKEKAFKNIAKKFRNWNGTFNGYQVFIPQDIKTVERQADILTQCLISNDYIQRMIDKESIMVFIMADNTPIATAELLGKEMKLGQFYADEAQEDCTPPEECKKALSQFMNKFIATAA